MAITVLDVSNRVSDMLQDAAMIRWPLAERVRWINEAMGAILTRRPSALSTTVECTLVAGTKQVIPENGAVLLDVVRNKMTYGVPGKAIRRTDRQLLDDSDPDWHTKTKKGVVKHFTFDDRLPREYYVYPPVIEGTLVDVVYAVLPADVEIDEAAELALGGEYMEPIVNYVCYRCNTKDSEFASPALAISFLQAFESSLGIKSSSNIAASPNQVSNSV